jgi:ABC-type multidrug transport system ATPase subunit
MVAGLVRPSAGEILWSVDLRPGIVRYFAGEHTLPPDVSTRQWQRLWGGRDRHMPAGSLSMLSRGTRQRVGLEATLRINGERLLLLDEPWEGLDPDASRWLSEALVRRRRAGVSVLVSSHRIHDLAEVCDRCEFLVGGRIVGDGTAVDPSLSPSERAEQLFAAFDRARSRR